MTSASSSSSCQLLHSIKTVWATVEPFLDLQSTIAASQACRALHEEIVDADTQKIKVSRFDNNRPEGPWTRIPLYVPYALNAIHFPSLRQISLGFPPVKLPDDGVEDIEDAVTSCFPILVSQLAYASNLESLSLNISEILHEHEDNGKRFEPLIVLFGRNLARCRKLKTLSCFLHCNGYCSYLMKKLVISLSPVLTKQKSVMRWVDFVIINMNSSFGNPAPRGNLQSAAAGFFAAMLSCTGLEHLSINVPHSFCLTNALLDAINDKCSSESYSHLNQCGTLQHLYIGIGLGMLIPPRLEERNEEQYLRSAKMMLEHFLQCRELRSLYLHLPLDIWEAHLETASKLIRGKTKLLTYHFNFCGYDDEEEKVIDLLENCGVAIQDNNGKRVDLQVQELRKVNGQRLFQLMQSTKDGRHPSDEKSFIIDLTGVASSDDEQGEGEGGQKNSFNVRDSMKEEDMPKKVDVEHFLFSNYWDPALIYK